MIPNRSRRGNTLIEFTLIGIPIMFVLISIFEMSRGMWLYQTMAYAIKAGNRYVIVHGRGCSELRSCCAVQISQIAERIRDAGVGLVPEDMQNVTFSAPGAATIVCSTLAGCLPSGSDADKDTWWPALAQPHCIDPASVLSNASDRNNRVEITAQYPFRSALAFFWPGAGTFTFGTFLMGGSSRESIQY